VTTLELMTAPTEDPEVLQDGDELGIRQEVELEEIQLGHDSDEHPEVVHDGQAVELVLGEEPRQLVDGRFRRHGQSRRRHQVADTDVDDLAHDGFLLRLPSRLGVSRSPARLVITGRR
jgi:hypothetical protein